MRIKKVSQTTPTSSQVVDGYSTSTNDSYSCNYVNGLLGKVLWENSNPTSSFAAQTITLNSNNYDYYILIWCTNNTNSQYLSTFSVKGKGVFMFWEYYSSYGSTHSLTREMSYQTDTTITFSNGLSNGSNDNNWCIPIKIIGFKWN